MHLSQTTKSIAVVKYFLHMRHSTLRQLNFRAGFLERSPLLLLTIVVIVCRRDDILATRMMLFGCSFDFVLLLLATETTLLLDDRLITFSLAAISEALEYRRFEMLLDCSFDCLLLATGAPLSDNQLKTLSPAAISEALE